MLVLLGEHDRLNGIWSAAVTNYPQRVTMPNELRGWWRQIYERITGGRR